MSISESHAKTKLDATSNGMVMTPAEFDAVRDYDDDCSASVGTVS